MSLFTECPTCVQSSSADFIIIQIGLFFFSPVHSDPLSEQNVSTLWDVLWLLVLVTGGGLHRVRHGDPAQLRLRLPHPRFLRSVLPRRHAQKSMDLGDHREFKFKIFSFLHSNRSSFRQRDSEA